jgi:hypothetical protein
MRWIIEGAVTATGQDVRTVIDAANASDAEAFAMSKGILVSSVKPDRDATLDALGAAARTAQARHVVPQVPEYPEIDAGAGTLRFLAALVAGVGWLFLLVGLGLIVFGVLVTLYPTSASGDTPVFTLVATGLGSTAYGVLILLAASLVRMLASVGLAVKDIAQNSFRR